MKTITSTNARNSTARNLFLIICFMLIAIFVLRPDISSEYTKQGINLCRDNLIPTLFPFMVISEILVRMGTGRLAARLMGKFMQKCFGVSGACAGALLMGVICGFPIGAKTTAAMYNSGDISKNDAENVMTFCNYPSSAFVISAIGRSLLGSAKIGIVIYAVLLSGGIGYGILKHMINPRKSYRVFTEDDRSSYTRLNVSLPQLFSDSVISAAKSMLSVCSFVIFFASAVGCLSHILGKFASGLPGAAVFSFFELTSGAAASAKLKDPLFASVLCAGGAGWSGVSVHLQIFTLTRTDREPISLSPYLIAKGFNSIFSAVSVYWILKLFPSLIPPGDAVTDTFSFVWGVSEPFIYAFNIFFALSLSFCLLKKLDRTRRI